MDNYKEIIKSYLKTLIDDLNKLLIIILIILIVLTLFIRNFFLDILKFLLFAIILYRIFSKNKYKRQKENHTYLSITHTLTKPFQNIIRNWKDRKKYVYRKCHKCHTTLKLPLPSKRGIHHSKCPKCQNRITIFTLRKEKIIVEVIKKKK